MGNLSFVSIARRRPDKKLKCSAIFVDLFLVFQLSCASVHGCNLSDIISCAPANTVIANVIALQLLSVFAHGEQLSTLSLSAVNFYGIILGLGAFS